MDLVKAEGILSHFTEIDDPREARGKRHLLLDILCIAILAVICDANDYEELEGYGLAKQEGLRSFLALPHGIPSAATFRRVFAAINPEAWQACCLNWVRSLALEDDEMSEEVLAAAGKTVRGSREGELGALHTVSVWASQQGIVVGQAQVAAHSNEITALPELIESLDVAGAVLTTDAMGTQQQVAWAARAHPAHQMLALKANHPTLHRDVMWLFEAAGHDWQAISHDDYETLDNAHGRQERRRYGVLDDVSVLDPEELRSWRDLMSVVCVESRRTLKGETSIEKRYYLASLPCDAKRAAHAIRSHWSVETNLHWVLDMSFREDESRVRNGHGQANWVTLRHIALNLLKLDTSLDASIKVKRKRAGWDNDYLLRLLKG